MARSSISCSVLSSSLFLSRGLRHSTTDVRTHDHYTQRRNLRFRWTCRYLRLSNHNVPERKRNAIFITIRAETLERASRPILVLIPPQSPAPTVHRTVWNQSDLEGRRACVRARPRQRSNKERKVAPSRVPPVFSRKLCFFYYHLLRCFFPGCGEL